MTARKAGGGEGASVKSAPKLPPYRLARVEDLTEYENNPRTHSADQVALLARMITEYGWTNPLLVDGKRGVIAGHGRLEAAKLLGMEMVPTIELRHLNAAQRRAYVIADNASALQAGWDRDLLALELGELREDGFDLELSGFDLGEIERLLGEPSLALGEADAGEKPAAVTCPSCGHVFAA